MIVPTAYWIRLRAAAAAADRRVHHAAAAGHPADRHRLRLYPHLQFRVAAAADRHRLGTTDILLVFGYVTLALPYMYRAVDTGLRAIDVRTLTEAAESLGAEPATILVKVIFPNVRVAVLSGAFLTFAIVIGEFTMASLLNRPAFGRYLQLSAPTAPTSRRRWPIIAFVVTWACMGVITSSGRGSRRGPPGRRPRPWTSEASMPFLEIDRHPEAFGDNRRPEFQPRGRARRVRLLPRPVAAAARRRRCA